MKGLLARVHQRRVDFAEFFFFIFAADKCLDRANGGQTLFYNVVEFIDRFLQYRIHRRNFPHDKKQRNAENRRAHHKHKRKLRVHPKRQENPHDNHNGASHQRAEAAVDCILQNRDVGRHARDKRGRLKTVQV